MRPESASLALAEAARHGRASNPMRARRRLANELRRLREAAGFTQITFAECMEWSTSTQIRYENGTVPLKRQVIHSVLRALGVDDDEIAARWQGLAREARRPAWWRDYGAVLDATVVRVLAQEASAVQIRCYEGMWIPDLLQTPVYALAERFVVAAPYVAPPDVAAEVYRNRTGLLYAPDGPRATFLVCESALHRRLAGVGIDEHAEQLTALLDWIDRDNVTVRVVPFGAPAHRGYKGSGFTHYDLDDGSLGCASIYEPAGAIRSFTAERDMAVLLDDFADIETKAADEAETRRLIEHVRSRFRLARTG